MKNYSICLWCGLLLFTLPLQAQKLQVSNLLCNYQTNPVGVEEVQPALNWHLQSQQNNVLQTAYRILVADDPEILGSNKGNIWDSDKVNSDQSIQITYKGKTLEPVKTYYWKVMVWENNIVSAWSKAASWQIGLLSQPDWKGARWIGYEQLPDSLRIVPALERGNPKWGKRKDILPLLRKEISLRKPVKKATMFISGLGQFELFINGSKVGDHFLDPGWTTYNKQALYITFDVTRQLNQGNNALGVMLGNGFYYIPGERYRKLEGAFGYPKMICRLAVQYQDGSTADIVSDDSWKTAPGPVTFSSIYGGEDYDATIERNGWKKTSYDDKAWKKAVLVDGPPQLNSQAQPALKVFENFIPKKISQPKPGVWVYDFGQNASGIPFIAVNGKKGATIKIIPGELLADDGTVTQNAIGSPVYFNYTLKGGGVENWQPQFMYYGFRYIQIDGSVPANETNPLALPVVMQAKLLHTRSAASTIGSFSCSNELFNKTFTLIDWAIRSNTVSVLTDCPHREKLGWLEEAHLVGSSIRYTYDIASLCRKIITDMKLSQTEEGLIPDIAPEYAQFGGPFRDSPEWGSNGIIMPWYVYQWYGDKKILADSYDMMTRYAAYLEKKSKNHILYFGLGDWYDIGPKDLGVSQLTPRGVTSTAIYYYDLTILSKIAALLGKSEDEQQFTALGKEVKDAFNATFYNKETRQYATGSQTANAMAIYMNLTEPENRQAVIDNLVKDLRNRNNTLTSGDIGYRYLLRALDEAGRSDVIFDMNSRSDVPGYGYQLARGATALTESWQGNRISSNNHFMLGHLMEWFYSGLAGIKSATNGVAFHDIEIRPEPVGDVNSVTASHQSPYGEIAVSWKKTDTVFTISVTIPANTKATIYLPSTVNSVVSERGRAIASVNGIHDEGFQNGRRVLKTGSGKYSFEVR